MTGQNIPTYEGAHLAQNRNVRREDNPKTMKNKIKIEIDVTKEVKRIARKRVGQVPASRVENTEREPKAFRKEKYKKDWSEWNG